MNISIQYNITMKGEKKDQNKKLNAKINTTSYF